MSHRVEVDKQSCQSSGRCGESEPGAFGRDADRLGEVLPGAAGLPRERLLAVARRCPAMAISVYDQQGGEIEP